MFLQSRASPFHTQLSESWDVRTTDELIFNFYVSEKVGEAHFLLREALQHIDTLEQAITRVGQEIEARMCPAEALLEDKTVAVETVQKPIDTPESQPETQEDQALTWVQAIILLCTIPGISQRAAEIILAEIGLDMSRFATANHLASWAGMCPGNYESAGKRLSGRSRKGSPWLRKVLVEAARVSSTHQQYLSFCTVSAARRTLWGQESHDRRRP